MNIFLIVLKNRENRKNRKIKKERIIEIILFK
jgi:hypothetical protein